MLELSHELDYIRWFFGEIKSVKANLNNSGTLGIDVEDSADLIMLSDAELPISLHLDFNRRHPIRCTTVYGSNGDLRWDALSKRIIRSPINNDPMVEEIDFERDFIYKKQLKHFLDCIERNTSPAVTLEDGVAVMSLVEAAINS